MQLTLMLAMGQANSVKMLGKKTTKKNTTDSEMAE
jgi:hypothetical protein